MWVNCKHSLKSCSGVSLLNTASRLIASLQQGVVHACLASNSAALFTERHERRLEQLEQIHPGLSTALRDLRIVRLRDSLHLVDSCAQLSADVFAGAHGSRPENLALLAGADAQALGFFFRTLAASLVEKPGNPSLALVDSGSNVRAALLASRVVSDDNAAVPEGPLGKCLTVLNVMETEGYKAARDQGLLDHDGETPVCNLFTVAKAPDLPGNVGQLARASNIAIDTELEKQSLGIVRDVFESCIMGAIQQWGMGVQFTGETTSLGSAKVLLAQNQDPWILQGSRFVWTPTFSKSLRALFAENELEVVPVKGTPVHYVEQALNHNAQFWVGRFVPIMTD